MMNPPTSSTSSGSSASGLLASGAQAEAKDTSFSIREKQKEVILRFLNLNSGDEAESYWQGVWKVLLYDDYCRDILAPLLKVGELRKQGITLHLSLHGDRQAIPDVPAIYFVSPTRENVQRIARDCVAKLYDSVHLNFSSAIPRPLLEELADTTLEADATSRIAKVYDQYVHFMALEDKLFTLGQERSYLAFNSPSITDAQAEANVEALALSLYSVIVTLGQVPIIRAPRNTAASMVAKRVCDRLREHLLRSSTLSDSLSSSFQRPLVVLVDRNVDMSVMFHHTWTYQALVHDLLDMKLNTIRLEQEVEADAASGKSGGVETKTYDLDPASDGFWIANAGNPWPKVVVDVQAQVKEYTAIMDEVKKLKVNDDDDPLASLDRTKHLGSLVGSMFEVTEKKRLVDMHLNIATALFERIKQRNLDAYLKLEEAITTHATPDKKEILGLLAAKGDTAEDKLRLFLIFYLTTAIPEEDLPRYEAALTETGVDLRPFQYLKKVKAFNNSLMGGAQRTSSRSGGSVRGSVTTSLASLVQQGVNHIKMWIPSSRHLYLTRVVDALMEQRGGSSLGGVEEQYEYYDPKVTNPHLQASMPRKNTPYTHAIVFVIGGGNYVEFQNLQDYAKEQPRGVGETPKQIIYGSTEILSARQFLAQLSELA